MDWLRVTLFLSIYFYSVAGSVESAGNHPHRQASIAVDRRQRPSSSHLELPPEEDQGRKVIDSYEVMDFKLADGEDRRAILARIIESTQNRHNWYRPAPSLRYRIPTTTKKPPLDEQWLMSAIENFVPSGFVVDAANAKDTKSSSKSEVRRTTKNVPNTTEAVPPAAGDTSYSYLKSTSTTTSSPPPPIIWIYTTTNKPSTTPESIRSSTVRSREEEPQEPPSTSSTTTTTSTTHPTPMRVFPFTRPLLKATSTTTSITSTTKTVTAAAGTAQAYWWEPNPSYQYPDIPPSDSETFYDYGDSPVAHLEHSQSVVEDVKPSLSIFPSIPRPIRRNSTMKTTSTTSSTTPTTISTTSTTQTTTSTTSTTTSTTPTTISTTPTTTSTTSATTSTTPTTTSTTPTTTSNTPTTTSTTTPKPEKAVALPPVDIPDEESGESDYEDDQNASAEHDGHYVVVNIWNYIGGKLTLMGQQKIPAEMFENMTVTDGDTVHSSSVPSNVVQLLTNKIAVDPSGNFQISNTITLTSTPPPMTKRTTSTISTTKKPYGGVGNPSLEGISAIQIRNKTSFLINSAPKPNPYKLKPVEQDSYVDQMPMSTYRPPAKTYPPHFPTAKGPFFKTTRIPTSTPPVMEYHNPPLDAILPDFIVEAFGSGPAQASSSSEEVPHYPEVTKKPFATLPYAAPPRPQLPGNFANFVPAHKRPEPPRVDPFRISSGSSTTTSKPATNSTSATLSEAATKKPAVKAPAPVRTAAVQTTSTTTGGRNTLVALGLSMLPTMAFALPFIAPLVGRKRRSYDREEEDAEEILRKLCQNPWRKGRKLPVSECSKFSLGGTELPRHFLLCTGDKVATMEMILLNY